MRRYSPTGWALSSLLMLAMIAACDDAPSSPLEPTDAPRLSTSGGGWTTIGGEEFYEYEGGYYPREGMMARIWGERTTIQMGDKRALVSASFEFNGHGTTQTTNWTLSRLDGTVLASNTAANYGSASGLLLSPLAKKHTGEFNINHPYSCDIRLVAHTEHNAWWIGFAVGPDPSKPIVFTRSSPQTGYSMDDAERPCDGTGGDDDGGGTGGGGGENCEWYVWEISFDGGWTWHILDYDYICEKEREFEL